METNCPNSSSFPTRECGLKLYGSHDDWYDGQVVPHAGTWIEIGIKTMNIKELLPSFPTRERGLKFKSKYAEGTLQGRSPRGNVD